MYLIRLWDNKDRDVFINFKPSQEGNVYCREVYTPEEREYSKLCAQAQMGTLAAQAAEGWAGTLAAQAAEGWAGTFGHERGRSSRNPFINQVNSEEEK